MARRGIPNGLSIENIKNVLRFQFYWRANGKQNISLKTKNLKVFTNFSHSREQRNMTIRYYINIFFKYFLKQFHNACLNRKFFEN